MDLAEMNPVDKTIKMAAGDHLSKLEKMFCADLLFFYGEIHPNCFSYYRKCIYDLAQDKEKKEKLVIFLNTPGGSVETVDRFVGVNRNMYSEVYFVIPDWAMSAGTVFCMSGDRIYMEPSSALGPIDPQIYNEKQYVPALGYLDKIKEYIQKVEQGIPLNAVDIFFLQRQDIAFLQKCEQQCALTETLIEKWLTEYKFKDWTVHSDTNKPVTLDEKRNKAKEIAKNLGNSQEWLSHGRCITMDRLESMGLKIDDYTKDTKLAFAIREYSDLLTSYIMSRNIQFFLHSRLYF